MYPNIVCNRPCTRVHVIRSNYYDDEYDTDKSYTSSKHSESFRDIRCQSSQTDLILIDKSAPSLYSWQRSSSCKDFNLPKVCPEVSSPANIDEINLSFDRNSSLDNPITKIFSSSYPGTTSSLSTESGSDRKIEKLGIIVKAIDPDDLYQDDVSQDSYELLEKEEVFDIHVSDEDEIFYVDSDNREHSQEIEKRLGYMEPKYRDIEFNKFNEICKKELASRSKEQIFSNHTIQFIAFENKSQTAAHLPVERTKSDSYMSVSKPKSHKLLHQKSIDLTPIESFEPIVSNFGMDISYTLHKRHTHEKGSPERDSVAKWSGNHFSQDSGLSLSMQSTSNLSVEDDSPIDLDTLLLNKYHDTVVTTSKSSELIQMAYKSVSLNESEVSSDRNLTDDKPNKLKSCHSAESMSLKSNNKQIHYQPLSADTANHRKSVEVIKINSTENIDSKPEDIIIVEYRGGNKGKKLAKDELRFNRDSKSSSYGGKIVEKNISKSPSNIFRTSAITLKTTSVLVSNNNKVHIVPNVNIVEESSNNRSPIDYNSLPDIVFNSVQCSSVSEKADKNIIELIGSKNNILSKKDEEQVVPNEVMNTNEIHSMSTLKLKNALSNLVSGTNNPNYSEQNISESKTAKINRFQTLASKISAFDVFANTVKITEKSSAELPRKNVPNKMLQNREKSPVLYARLGLSDGSMFPTVSGVQLSVQRRAISLDSPVVSLHHLPLATSFSSKDDTVADIEDSAKLEIKPIIWWNDNEVDQMIVECIAEIVEITVANQVEQKRDSGSSLSPDKTSERRRSSTRQERLDSFKKLKNFEIEIWDSDELNAAALIDYEHKDFEDETFDIPIEVTPIECSKLVKISDTMIASPDNNSVSLDESGNGSSEEIPFKELNSQSSDDTKKTARKNSEHNTFSDLIKAVEKNNLDDKLNEPLTPGSESKVEVDQKVQNQKNYQSFLSTEDIINHSELINKLGCIEIPPKLESKRHRLSVESSGSSSLDDPLHIDDLSGNIADEEDVTSSPLPPLPDSTYSGGMYLIGYGMYGMSRTLSRISEQSTSERSEIDDELSTKHSTQSASLDDSILSSDYCQPSLCSDAMDSLPDLPPLPEEYAFDIPPPAVDDVEWPSPKSEEKTPIPQQQQRNLEEDEDDAKTIHSDDEPDKEIDVTKEKSKEVEALYRSHYTNKPRLSLGDDTSAGVSTSEFSSNATIVCPFDSVCPPSDYLIREDYSDEYDSPFTEESDESKFYRPPAHLFELPKTTNIRIKGRLSHGPASLDVTTNTSKFKGSTKTRCHSYFSLARSPPSDASSSSLDAQDPLNVPNTIPRASKKRRYTHTLRRKIKAIQITKV
ncbi:uncharacterized protein LOC126905284 [Daktulosphaira vitifoliae]|uniref:uncharacterized protein LOC126905284 n=1 Tax=Daktulosphaira vitifoliae TaxID=58002 RepID=UPI0021AA73A3|nr:uncharacterized protein LOC126905284 [Daktulosphaira vitifoliae]